MCANLKSPRFFASARSFSHFSAALAASSARLSALCRAASAAASAAARAAARFRLRYRHAQAEVSPAAICSEGGGIGSG